MNKLNLKKQTYGYCNPCQNKLLWNQKGIVYDIILSYLNNSLLSFTVQDKSFFITSLFGVNYQIEFYLVCFDGKKQRKFITSPAYFYIYDCK